VEFSITAPFFLSGERDQPSIAGITFHYTSTEPKLKDNWRIIMAGIYKD